MCLVAKPIVDGLESDLQGRAHVLRLNLLDSVGMSAARRFGVRAVPTFIVLDGEGQVVDVQIGIPNRARLGAQVDSLMAK
jgi:thioredoxin-like negative regulator of GroEL